MAATGEALAPPASSGLLKGIELTALLRYAAGTAALTFVLTLGIIGFELVSAQTGLQLHARPGAVLYAVIAATLAATALWCLERGNTAIPLLLGAATAGVLLLALLGGGDGQTLGWLLPFKLVPLNWLALLVPVFVLVRAVMLLRGPRTRTALAPGAQASRSFAITLAVGLGMILFAIALPFLPFANRQLVDIATLVLMYIMLGWGLNIVVGLAGLLDLGYVAFYAVGAYSYALLSLYFGLTFWECLPIAGLLAASVGVLLGFPVLRLRGDYLAIVTLGLGEIVRIVLINWDNFTGGPNGIGNIPRPSFFGLPFQRNAPEGTQTFHTLFGLEFSPDHRIIFLYYVILVCALATVAFSTRIRRLPIGRAWEALREDEIASKALGINRTRVKLAAFGTGAMFAGFAGSFFAARQGFISPESFTFIESAVILAIVVLGGLGSNLGIVFAAIILIGVPEFFRELKDYRMLAFGLVMVLIMVWRPSGLVSRREPSARLNPRGGPT